MQKRIEQLVPHARKEGLVVKQMPDEVLVYDLDRYEAHCLNQTAAVVWKHCDGRTTVAEVARILGKEAGTPVGEEVVLFTLDQLRKVGLLNERAARPSGARAFSRRQVLGKLGAAALLSAPLIMSIPVPTAAVSSTLPCIPEDQCNGNEPNVGGNNCQPCHTTGSSDCAKRCRRKPGSGAPQGQCVGVPAGTCT